MIDPNAKLSYIDEFVVGVEREVMPNTTVGVRYIHRNIAARARGRRELPDGGVRVLGGDVGRVRQRRLHPDEPEQRDADQPGAARDRAAVQQRASSTTRSTSTTRSSSR